MGPEDCDPWNEIEPTEEEWDAYVNDRLNALPQPEGVHMPGLFNRNQETREGKYLVQRRDGTVPEWAWFVLGAADPAAPEALRAYAAHAERLHMDPVYVNDIRRMANEWEAAQLAGAIGTGDPDAGPHRTDDPAIIENMRKRPSA